MQKFIKQALYKNGIVLRRRQPWMNNFRWLEEHKINTIIDVGANEGQFAAHMRSNFPQATIYSFEPVESVFKKLQLNFKTDEKVKLYNMGLGDIPSSMEMNVNDFSPSSSLLELDRAHKENYTHAINTHKETITIETLDAVLREEVIKKNLLIKIDVQGYEDKVILGGKKTFESAKIALIETSFKPLYKGQKLFEDIYALMMELGFRYRGTFGELNYDNTTGDVLFGDSIFVKE